MTEQTGMPAKWLFAGSFLANTGTSFIWPLTTIYLHDTLGKSLIVAGLVLLCNSLCVVLGNTVGGFLYDRWSHFYTILAGSIIVIFGSTFLMFNNGWPAFPLGLMLLGFGNGLNLTSINSFATEVKNKRTSYIFNVLYFMSNLGMVIGTLLVGYILPYGISKVFAISLVLFIIFGIIVVLFYRNHEGTRNISRGAALPPAEKLTADKLRPLLALLFNIIVLWIFYEQWQSNIATFMVENGLSIKHYSSVWTLNGIMIVLIQPFMTYFDEWLMSHLHMRLYGGLCLIGTSFIVLLFAGAHYYLFMASMAILTIGEILVNPAASTFVDNLSPVGQKGRFQGSLASATSFGRALGPLIGAVIIDYISYTSLFILATLCIWLAVFGFSLINRHYLHQ